jgi:hypothetical protein
MMTLESRLGRMCGANLGKLLGFVTSKRLWVVVHVFLSALIQKSGYHDHFQAMASNLLCNIGL